MRVRPLAAGFWMLVAAAAAATAIWVTTAWLLGVAEDAPAAERAKIRVDAVRTGLAAGAGAGAAVGLLLAFRRQHHQELATALNELDAAARREDAIERRITELYNAAAEQLGSDKAPVRLTALYTLERLANDNVHHQQTIVNIICAYLRMPYTPPATPGPEEEHRERAHRHASRYRAARAGQPAPAELAIPPGPDPHEEHQVRLTAQRLLHAHLHKDADVHWDNISLDLTGATLTDFTLADCHVHVGDFTHASFIGHTRFGGAAFYGIARFDQATFSGHAMFDQATFYGPAWFRWVTFSGGAGFNAATFSGWAMFDRATFSGSAGFDAATFSGRAVFGGAAFSANAAFDAATFSQHAMFDKVIFSEDVGFDMAAFSRGARFGGATFSGVAMFDGATFSGRAVFGGATFSGRARFSGATFSRDAVFDQATFDRGARFDQATFGGFVGLGAASFPPDGVDLEAAVVLDIGLAHQVPNSWRIEPADGTEGRFVRAATPLSPAGP